MPDRTTGLRVKIERAKEHIGNLAAEIQAFWDSGPYEIVTDDDSEPEHIVYRVLLKGQPAPRLGAIAGDAVHNLRASLDLLIWQLVLANGKTPDPDFAKFRIFKHPNEVGPGLGKIEGLPESAVDRIKAFRPYESGNHLLYQLHRLDIADKHHVLLPAVFVGGMMAFNVQKTREVRDEALRSGQPPPPFVFAKYGGSHPVEDKTEIFRVPKGDAHMYMKPQFSRDIAFREPEIVKGQSVLGLLHQFANLVEGFVEPFLPMLRS
jgi:hypothetical protein